VDIAALRLEAETPRTAAAGEIEAVARDLAAAFVDDPIFDWFLRDDHRRDAARLSLLRLVIRDLAFKTGRIDRPASGAAAAVWIPSENIGPNPLLDELRAAVVILGASGLGRIGRVLAFRSATEAHHPHMPPHDYLYILGVRPEAQGAGIGSRLIRAHTAELDRRGRPAFLETATPRNLPLYQGHGFAIVDEYRPAPGAPTMWAMWRDPRPRDLSALA